MTDMLDGIDKYKLDMSQFQKSMGFHDVTVKFQLQNRGKPVPIDIEKVRQKLSEVSTDNLNLGDPYTSYIKSQLHECVFDDKLSVTGPWPVVTLWETIVMSTITELYALRSFAGDQLPVKCLSDGMKKLEAKVATLNQYPDIRFSDFGTRRRASLEWHKTMLEYLKSEAKGFVGTSNVGLGRKLDIPLIGTHAHEMFMVYCGLADISGYGIRKAPLRFMRDWHSFGSGNTYLSDTYGVDRFLVDFRTLIEERAKNLIVRHDSGDPFLFGEKMIGFWLGLGLDPKRQQIVFSDNLDTNRVVRLYEHFSGRVNVTFGIGTHLTNDLGLDRLNIVMKPVSATRHGTTVSLVKLSDDPLKASGTPENIRRYRNIFGS